MLAGRQPNEWQMEGGSSISHRTTAMMLPTYGTYVATKGAVEQLTHILAKELGSRGITVNVISPGPTDTELFKQGKSRARQAAIAQMAALGRLGRPQDIADVVALLVSDDANWITGQNMSQRRDYLSAWVTQPTEVADNQPMG